MSWCNYGQKWLYLFHPCKNLYNTCSNRSLIESIKKIHVNDLCKFIVNGIMKNQHKIHRCFCKYLLSAIDGFFVWSAYPHSMFHEKKSKTACNMVQSMWTCFVCKKKKRKGQHSMYLFLTISGYIILLSLLILLSDQS